MKKYVIILIITFVVFFILLGLFVGFSWERGQGIKEVKKYVEEKYNLTPKEISISFSIKGMDGAMVWTEEYPFGFDVYVNRDSKKVWGDLFLESFVEYNLEDQINKEVEILSDTPKVNVILETRFSKDEREVSLEKITENPDSILNNPQISYSCYINGLDPKTKKAFQIFKIITDNFNPTSIRFYYIAEDKKEKNILFDKNDYDIMNTYEKFELFSSE